MYRTKVGWHRAATRGSGASRARLRSILVACVALASVIALPATTASASRAHHGHSKSPLLVDVFAPFSGPEAAYGNFANLPGVKSGVQAVNAAGGAMGHQFTVMTTDDLGDVADAVPIAHQLVATHSNLTAVYGNPGQEAFETSKIFNAAHIVEFSVAGFDQLNHVRLKYFYRTFPPDSAESTAWGASIVKTVKHARVAIVMDATADTSSSVPPLVHAINKGGGKVVINLTVQPKLPSYASVIQRIQAAKPNVIAWTLSDDQSAATFASNLQQFGLLNLPQRQASETPDWAQAVSSALHISEADLGKYFTFVAPQPGNSKSYEAFMSAFTKLYPGRSGPFNSYNLAMYDGVIITALAMDEAHSTKPKVFNKMITNVTKYGRTRVKVYDYRTAVKMLKRGKKIQYIGAAGHEIFNKFHWTNGNWMMQKPTATGAKTIKVFSARKLEKLAK